MQQQRLSQANRNFPRARGFTSRSLAAFFLCLSLCNFDSIQANASTPAPTTNWVRLARHVGENEKSHATAIRELKKIKDLDTILVKALETPERFHSLDVIAALKKTELIPQLLERVSADEDGFLVLTLNSLLNAETKNLILNTYLEKLKPERQVIHSAAAIVAMLEPLDRAGLMLPKETLASLFDHSYPEVRSSALSYVRAMILKGKRTDYQAYVLKALSSSPYQLRLQALALVEELGRLEKPIDLSSVHALCEKDKNAHVRTRCAEVAPHSPSIASVGGIP